MIQLRLLVAGMHCDHCVQAVRNALLSLPGVTDCHVEIGSANVRLDEEKTGRHELIAAIRNTGDYDVDGFSVER